MIEIESPSGASIQLVRRSYGAGGRRVAIVAGLRGDAPEGIRVAWEVGAALAGCEERLQGRVDIYPCANPLAAHGGTSLWPFFDVDMNRLFPGREGGHPPDRAAHALCQDMQGADQIIELRGARPAFREVAQAHVRQRDPAAAELAMEANVAVVWCRRPGPAATSTLAHQFPGTIVLEGGTGNRLTAGVGRDIRDGVLHILSVLGILQEADLPFHWAGLHRPLRVNNDQVRRVRAERGGLFLPVQELWTEVEEGQMLGRVVDPLSGQELEGVQSPCSGLLMAVRELPVVFPGSMVARVVQP